MPGDSADTIDHEGWVQKLRISSHTQTRLLDLLTENFITNTNPRPACSLRVQSKARVPSASKNRAKNDKTVKSRTPTRRSSRKSSPINYREMSSSDMEEDEDDGNGANEAQAMPSGLIQSDLLAQAKDRSSAGSDSEGDANGDEPAKDKRRRTQKKAAAPRSDNSGSKGKRKSTPQSVSRRQTRARTSVSPKENKSTNLPTRRSKRKAQVRHIRYV